MKFPNRVAVAAVALFALAACGGSGTGPTSASPSTVVGTSTLAPSVGTTPTATVDATPTPTVETATPSPTTGAVGPCALLSPADLKTGTGDAYGAGALDAVGRCQWRASSGPKTVVAFVSAQALDRYKSSNPGGADVTVSGHAAYAITQDGTTTELLWVDVGGKTLALQVVNYSWETPSSGAAAIKQIALKLAAIAIGNI